MTSTADMQDLLNEIGIGDLAIEERLILERDLAHLVLRGSLVRIFERMDDDIVIEFDLLMDQGPELREIMVFFRDRVSGADDAVEEAFAELRNDILLAVAG